METWLLWEEHTAPRISKEVVECLHAVLDCIGLVAVLAEDVTAHKVLASKHLLTEVRQSQRVRG